MAVTSVTRYLLLALVLSMVACTALRAQSSSANTSSVPAEMSSGTGSTPTQPSNVSTRNADQVAVPISKQRVASDLRNELPPGQDPDNRLIVPFAKHLVSDQEAFWTTPAHFQVKDLKWAVPFVGVTAAFVASDSWMSKQIPLGKVQTSKTFSDYATYSLIGAGGSAFLLGHLTGNDRMSEAGLLSGEAAINSTAVAYLLKNAFQRPRPYEANGSGAFFKGGSSFPSEHSAIAWSIASVMAHEYPGTFTKILAYGLATGISATRVTGQQHFASDVIVGGALGWYFGRQVYRAHHDTSLGGGAWGDLIDETPTEHTRNPENMGSPYVPLDSWVYPALERLIALGYVKTGYLGIRPWTRMECARMLEEVEERLGDDDDTSSVASSIYRELSKELLPETHRLDGAANLGASIDSVYVRAMNISGPPLRDGYHFGQTIINDYGRPYGEGTNLIAGTSVSGVAGPLSFYLRGEYQQAPSLSPYSPTALHVAAKADFGGIFGPNFYPPGYTLYSGSFSRFRLLDANVGLTWRGVQFSFGKQTAWLGPEDGGTLLFSDNAEPLPMFRIRSVTPFRLPLLSRLLGDATTEYFVGRLSGQHWAAVTSENTVYPGSVVASQNGMDLIALNSGTQPFIHGGKISFKPTDNLELGMGITYVFGGPGFPFTWHRYLHTYSLSSGTVNGPNSPGDRRSGFDISYRVPKLRDWMTFYIDSMTEDEISPIGSNRPSVNAGLFFPQLPKIPHLSLRLEGVYTNAPNLKNGLNGFVYWNSRYPNSYTNNGNLLASWVGRQGAGEQGSATYSISSRRKLEFGFRRQVVDEAFAEGGRLMDGNLGADFLLSHGLSVAAFFQYETWRFPALGGGNRSNMTGSVQLTLWPHFSRQN